MGVINRSDFTHWGPTPSTASPEYGDWVKGARSFGKAVWEILGERISPQIVFERPVESMLPTFCFVCATGGMVVICAGTTGDNVTMELRCHWIRQKRFQGSRLSNDEEAAAVNRLVSDRKIGPCMCRVFF